MLFSKSLIASYGAVRQYGRCYPSNSLASCHHGGTSTMLWYTLTVKEFVSCLVLLIQYRTILDRC